MYYRLLSIVVFVLLFVNIWSLRCYEGNSTSCKLSADADKALSGFDYVCIKYYSCSMLLSHMCDQAELNSDKYTWEYMIADQAGCDYIKQSKYMNTTCCSTDRCNAGPAGQCSED
ncbi:hypothetical protein I4U23_015285 [Adineta vaga]|nr:hypothetical protein I4U23_015285 [Adineta vaga]